MEQYIACLANYSYLPNLANIKLISEFFKQMKAQFPVSSLGSLAKLQMLRYLATVSVMNN